MKPSFEWDDGKNEQNKEKHGVLFLHAQYAFADPNRVIIEDLGHSENEDRFFCFGKVKGGIMTVRFTERQGRIRIIGAGYRCFFMFLFASFAALRETLFFNCFTARFHAGGGVRGTFATFKIGISI